MFPVKIPFYSLMILLALAANIIVVLFISKKYSILRNEIICLLLYENVGIVIGAKIFTFLEHYKEVSGEFDFISLGLASYGAVIGAGLFLILFAVQFKNSFEEILYIFMPSMPLMYGIGKVGCFLAGCCYGIQYDGVGSIVYNHSHVAPKGIPLFPVQIVETVFFIGVFIYIMTKNKKSRLNLKTAGISLILCALGKFGLEFLRENHIGQILSIHQIISLLFAILGIGMIIIDRYRKRTNMQIEHIKEIDVKKYSD